MLIGIGLDLVDIERIQRIVAREETSFIRLLLSERELQLYEELRAPRRRTEWLSGRFAAKEAASKALGTGLSSVITPRSLEILPDSLGKPELMIPDAWVNQYKEPICSHVTITHTKHTAAAVVMIERIEAVINH